MKNKTIFDFFQSNKTKDSITEQALNPQPNDKPLESKTEECIINDNPQKDNSQTDSDFFDPNAAFIGKKTSRNEQTFTEKNTELKRLFNKHKPTNDLCQYSLKKEDLKKRIIENEAILNNVILKNKKTSKINQAKNNKPLFSVMNALQSNGPIEEVEPKKPKQIQSHFELVSNKDNNQEVVPIKKRKICSLFMNKAVPVDYPGSEKLAKIFLSTSYKKK